MKITRGFHATFPTDVADEIDLANRLHMAIHMRHGIQRLPRLMQADPAKVLGKMAYCRLRTPLGGLSCVHGVRAAKASRATNESILTPGHAEWPEFLERLESHLACPDFDEFFGAPKTGEYWPLCSAQLVSEMGFAIAETLCLFLCFCGDSDPLIAAHVESMWQRD